MPGKIFINYRRDDTMPTAGRLHDRLAQTFGRDNVFMDVDQIPAGVDFASHLNAQVAACEVFLTLIGSHWLDAKDDIGFRRINKPDDFVAIEIAAALGRDILVIPVLVDGARMPIADELPVALQQMPRRNAVEMRNKQFGRDAEVLIRKIREALPEKRSRSALWGQVSADVAAIVLASILTAQTAEHWSPAKVETDDSATGNYLSCHWQDGIDKLNPNGKGDFNLEIRDKGLVGPQAFKDGTFLGNVSMSTENDITIDAGKIISGVTKIYVWKLNRNDGMVTQTQVDGLDRVVAQQAGKCAKAKRVPAHKEF
jgi:hypothetical protein